MKTKQNTEAGGGAGTPGLCPRVPGVGRGVMMGVYVQDLMRLDEGEVEALALNLSTELKLFLQGVTL